MQIVHTNGPIGQLNICIDAGVVAAGFECYMSAIPNGITTENGQTPMVLIAQGYGIMHLGIGQFLQLLQRIYIYKMIVIAGVKLLESKNIGTFPGKKIKDLLTCFFIVRPIV